MGDLVNEKDWNNSLVLSVAIEGRIFRVCWAYSIAFTVYAKMKYSIVRSVIISADVVFVSLVDSTTVFTLVAHILP